MAFKINYKINQKKVDSIKKRKEVKEIKLKLKSQTFNVGEKFVIKYENLKYLWNPSKKQMSDLFQQYGIEDGREMKVVKWNTAKSGIYIYTTVSGKLPHQDPTLPGSKTQLIHIRKELVEKVK